MVSTSMLALACGGSAGGGRGLACVAPPPRGRRAGRPLPRQALVARAVDVLGPADVDASVGRAGGVEVARAVRRHGHARLAAAAGAGELGRVELERPVGPSRAREGEDGEAYD